MVSFNRLVRHTTAVAGLACFGVAIIGYAGLRPMPQAQAQQSQPRSDSSEVSAAGITLHSVDIELPSSDRTFPGGADAEVINNNCLGCHSAGMVLHQPALTRAAWQQEVEKMRAQYKAPVADSDVPAIVAYLVNHKGLR